MIYAKIYLDTERESLIFEAAGKDDGIYLSHAKKIYDRAGRLRFVEEHTRVQSVKNVAISPEAKAALLALMNNPTLCKHVRYDDGDLQLVPGSRESYGGYDPGYFAFRPSDPETPTLRIQGLNEPFALGVENGIDQKSFDDMQEKDNEFLKALDLTLPI